MGTTEESVRTLVGLGLSGTQARICLALAVIGTSTIREISEASVVARPETYRAVVELEKKGLVEKSVSAPTRYSLLPLQDVLSILVGRRETESLELQDRSATLLEEYEKKLTEKRLVNENQFVLVPSGKAFSNRLRKSIENSKKSICVIAHQKNLTPLLDCMQGMLKRAIGKEVNVRIVTEKRGNSSLTKRLFSLQKSAHFEIRFANILPPFSLATFDEKGILLSTKAQSENDSAFAVYSNNSSLAELSQSYLNDAWSSAAEPPGLAFKRNKLQFDNLFANMNSGFAYCKMLFNDENKPVDFVYLQINNAFERIIGLNRSQVIGKRVSKVIPGFEKENRELFEIFDRVCRSQIGEQCEIFLRPLNCWRHMCIYSPKRGFIAVLFEDITQRKKAELELKQRYDLLESLGENVDAGLVIVDKDFRIVWANKLLRNVGALPGELCYQRLAHAEAVCPDCGVAKIFDQNVPVDIHEYKRVNSKRETNWIELRVTPLKDEKGNVTSALELAVSINERKKTEGSLRESEERLRLAQNSAHVGIWDWNLSSGKVEWTEELEKIYAYEPGTFPRSYEAFQKRVYPEDIVKVEALRDEAVKLHELFDFDFRVQLPSGEIRWVNCKGGAIYDEEGKPQSVFGVNVDITERKKAEKEHERLFEEVLAAEKLVKADLDAMTRLQKLGTQFVQEASFESILTEIVDTAIAICSADFGTIQLLDSKSGDLKIVAQRGLPKCWLNFWNSASKGRGTCGTALERGERVIVEDVEQSPIFVGTRALQVQLEAGVRAVQSTPLTSRSGKLIGMFSTHYKTPHRPDDRSLQLLDLLARQAADIIERAQNEGMLQQ